MELHRRSFSRTLATGPRARLRVENRNGLISVRAHDRPEIVVEVVAEVYADSSRDADIEAERIQRGITSRGETVAIQTPELLRPQLIFFGRGPRVDYEVAVPADTAVEAESRNGKVEVRGVRGPVSVGSRNGAVTVQDCAESVTAEARNGRVTVLRCGSSVELKARNGPIVAERVSGALTVETRNGSVTVSDAGDAVRVAGTNGGIRYTGPVRGDVDLTATNGGIRIAVPVQSRFEIDAESRHGGVFSSLPVREAPRPGEGTLPKVRARTVNGAIRIEELR